MLHLARQGIAFQGHREDDLSLNKGIFFFMVSLF